MSPERMLTPCIKGPPGETTRRVIFSLKIFILTFNLVRQSQLIRFNNHIYCLFFNVIR